MMIRGEREVLKLDIAPFLKKGDDGERRGEEIAWIGSKVITGMPRVTMRV